MDSVSLLTLNVDTEMLFPRIPSTSSLCSSIFGTASPEYACDGPNEVMMISGNQEISSRFITPESESKDRTEELNIPVISNVSTSNYMVVPYHLPFRTPPTSTLNEIRPRITRVPIDSETFDSPLIVHHQTSKDSPIHHPRKLQKIKSHRSQSVNDVKTYPFIDISDSRTPTSRQLSYPSILFESSRKLSLVWKRGIGSLRRYSKIGGWNHHIHRDQSQEEGIIWNDPFRIDPSVNHHHQPELAPKKRSQQWKTHARRTLSRSGKESISLPMECLSPGGGLLSSTSEEMSPDTSGSESTHELPRTPTSDGRNGLWRSSLSPFKARPPTRPMSRPILSSRTERNRTNQNHEESPTRTVQLQRLAALARLEGKTVGVPGMDGSDNQGDCRVDGMVWNMRG